jgi:hypothetical protein
LKRSFEKLSLKVSGIFNGAEFIIFTALMKHKRQIFEKLAGILVICALASRTVCEWSRCESKLFVLKNRVKKRSNPWEPLEKAHVDQKYPFLDFEKLLTQSECPSGGL